MKLRWPALFLGAVSTLTLAASYSSPPEWTPQQLPGYGQRGGGEIPDPFPQGRLVAFPLPTPNTVPTEPGTVLYGDLVIREDGSAVLVYSRVLADQADIFAVRWDGSAWDLPALIS